jgi:hypothetical protein
VGVQVLRCDGKDAAHRCFQHSLKQACYMQHGSANLVMNLPKARDLVMWDAVCRSE